jgi:hypothetical protein
MNIKRFTLLTLSVVVLALGVSFLSTNNEAKYFPKESIKPPVNTAQGYIEFIESIKANKLTGSISQLNVAKGIKQADKMEKGKALNLSWEFKGPDNIGGRVRAFAIDMNDNTHLVAGGAAGGIFESFDQGQTWNVYDPEFKVKNISCITQSSDGSFYVGTGLHFEVSGSGVGARGSFFIGSGIHKLTGNGTFENIISPQSGVSIDDEWSTVGQLVSDPSNPNKLYAATNNGFRIIDMSGASPAVSDPIDSRDVNNERERADDVDVTSDGKVIVSYFGGNIYTSQDNAVSFTRNRFGAVGRTEIAFAPSNSNIVYASMANRSNNCLFGVFRSNNGGLSWDRISPQGGGNFAVFSNSLGCQGWYDNTIAVYPNDPGRIIVGGITLYRWEQSTVDPAPVNGSWNQIDVTVERNAGGVSNSSYVHADKHRIVFDPQNPDVAYIASDGGISKSENIRNIRPSYTAINNNLGITQFYDIGVNSNDLVMGGTQDNGTNLIGLDFNNGRSGFEVLGGDGFSAEMSTINPSIGIATIYNNRLSRIQGINTSVSNSNFSTADITSNNPFLGGLCNTPQGCNGIFYTATKLWESFDHQASKDTSHSVFTESLVPPLAANRIINYKSNNSSVVREIVTPFQVIKANTSSPADTLKMISDFGNLYTLVGNEYQILPIDTLFGDGADAPIDVEIKSTTGLVFNSNNDILTLDTTNLSVSIRHSNGQVESLSYVLGTAVSYVNEFFGSVTFEVNEKLVNGNQVTVFSYYDIQISFAYDLAFKDKIQSVFASANWPGQGANYSERNIFISRDLMKSKPSITWHCIAGARSTPHRLRNGDNVLTMEFSRDGNILFVGTRGGKVYRISNLDAVVADSIESTGGNIYFFQENLLDQECHIIGEFDRAVTDIAVDPSNPDNLAVTLGNYGSVNYVARTTTATTADSSADVTGMIKTFEFIQGSGTSQLPSVPAYAASFDINNPGALLIGNDLGLFATEDFFASNVIWTEETVGMGRVPVYDIEQMIQPWPYSTNTGKIYVGTHGRGIYESGSFVGIVEDDNDKKNDFKSSLKFYPNPVKNNAKVEFKLATKGSVDLKVFDVTGKLILDQKIINLVEGSNVVDVNTSDLDNGTYVIQVISGSEAVTNKFVVFK